MTNSTPAHYVGPKVLSISTILKGIRFEDKNIGVKQIHFSLRYHKKFLLEALKIITTKDKSVKKDAVIQILMLVIGHGE